MSFQTIPAQFTTRQFSRQSAVFNRLSRMLLPIVFGLFLMTTTGCSMVMGIFGPTDTATVVGDTVVTDDASRILMPTPIDPGIANVRRPTPGGPTPTPFVMQRAEEEVALPSESNSISLEVSATQESLRAVTVLGQSVNVRNAPGLDTQVLATVAKDAEFDYVGESENGEWIQICCIESQMAWIYGELVQVQPKPSNAMSAIPVARQGNIVAGVAPGQTVTQNPALQTRLPTLSNTSLAGGGLAEGLERLSSSGGASISDGEAGFALVLPAGWMTFADPNGLVEETLSQVATENANVASFVEDQLEGMDELPVLLVAFDLSATSLTSGFPTNVNVLKQPVPAGFPLAYIVQLNSQQLGRLLGLSTAANSTTITLPAGQAVTLDYMINGQAIARQYYLLAQQSLYVVTFTAAIDGVASSTQFDEIMQSFQFVN